MFVDLLLAMLFSLAIIPLVTGYCAYSHGRSFWGWFALGLVFPVGSFFVLVALLYRQLTDPGEQLLAQARAVLAEAEAAARRPAPKRKATPED